MVSEPFRRFVDSIDSLRGTALGIVGVDTLRYLEQATILARIDFIPPVLSLVAGWTASPPVVLLTTLSLFAIGFYAMCPRIFPDSTGLPAKQPYFRLSFVACAVTIMWLAMTTFALSGNGESEIGVVGILWGIAAPFALGGVLVLVLWRVGGWDIFDPGEQEVQPIECVFPDADVQSDIRSDIERGGFLGTVGMVIWLLALSVLLGLGVTITGIAGFVLANTYPIPDVLAVLYILSGIVTDVPTQITDRLPDRIGFDFEDEILTLGRDVFNDLPTLGSLIFIGVGMVSATMLYGAGYTNFTAPTVSQGYYLARAWIYSISVFPMVVATYLLWVWYRIARRIPAVVAQENGGSTAASPLARPPLVTVPPVVGFIAYVVLIRWVGSGDGIARMRVGSIVVAVVVVGLFCCAVTRWRARQPVTHEHAVVLFGLVVQVTGLFGAIDFASTELPGSKTGLNPGTLVWPLLSALLAQVPVALFLVTMSGAVHVITYASKRSDLQSYAGGMYLVMLGIVALVVRETIDFMTPQVETVLVTICLLGGLALLVGEWVY